MQQQLFFEKAGRTPDIRSCSVWISPDGAAFAFQPKAHWRRTGAQLAQLFGLANQNAHSLFLNGWCFVIGHFEGECRAEIKHAKSFSLKQMAAIVASIQNVPDIEVTFELIV